MRFVVESSPYCRLSFLYITGRPVNHQYPVPKYRYYGNSTYECVNICYRTHGFTYVDTLYIVLTLLLHYGDKCGKRLKKIFLDCTEKVWKLPYEQIFDRNKKK